MKIGLRTWTGVVVAAVLTTMGAMALAQGLVFVLYPDQALQAALHVTPIITVITAFPFCVFVWSRVRLNMILGAELQRLVNRDRLTNVATRDFFFARMRDDPNAYGTSLMVDIDYFKKVNDTFGHLAGDVVISRVAAILRDNTRENDIVCRFGGEEFVVFLYEQGHAGGFDAAERMRQAIADAVIDFEGQDMSVTVSIGGSLKERLNDVNLAIQQADQALYMAKSGGRNQTVFSKPTLPEQHIPAA